jgi:hypothetical protein
MRSQIADSPPAWSNRLIGELDAADQHAKELVSALTAEQLNWRPQRVEFLARKRVLFWGEGSIASYSSRNTTFGSKGDPVEMYWRDVMIYSSTFFSRIANVQDQTELSSST